MLLPPAADPLQSAVVIAPQCNPLEHERDYDFGMDALVIVCSWNTNGIEIWHGCSGNRMLFEHERDYDLAWYECLPSLEMARPEPPHGSTTLRRRFRVEGAQNLRPKRQHDMASAGYSICALLRRNVWAEG